MQKLIAVLSFSVMTVVACGPAKMDFRTDGEKKTGNEVGNPNGNGGQNGGTTTTEELPPPASNAASYVSQDGIYEATLVRDGSAYFLNMTNLRKPKTPDNTWSLQNIPLGLYTDGTYRGSSAGIDYFTLTASGNACTLVWREVGYGTYNRVFSGPCP